MTTDFDDLPIISGKCGCLCYCDGTDQERDREPSFHWEDHGCAILSEIDSISMRCSLILASPLQGERIKVRGFEPSARILPTKRSSSSHLSLQRRGDPAVPPSFLLNHSRSEERRVGKE